MIQFISHHTVRHSYIDSIRLALEGGCKWVQLRMKDASTEEMRPVAIEAKRLCQEHEATLIIDDNVALVKEIHADGVHLGKNDMPIDEARRMLGPEYIIGGTANTFEDIQLHHLNGADYIGCGPFRFTTTKKGLSPILGLDGYRSIILQMREAGIDLPIVAIGGITEADIPSIMETGVNGIAISGTVLNAEHPAAKMQQLLDIIRQYKDKK